MRHRKFGTLVNIKKSLENLFKARRHNVLSEPWDGLFQRLRKQCLHKDIQNSKQQICAQAVRKLQGNWKVSTTSTQSVPASPFVNN